MIVLQNLLITNERLYNPKNIAKVKLPIQVPRSIKKNFLYLSEGEK